MQLIIRGEKTLVFEGDNIDDLQRYVQDVESLPIRNQILFCKGRIIDDSNWNEVEDGDEIQINGRLRGGKLTDSSDLVDKDVINDVTKDIIEKIIGSNSYQHANVEQWTTSICSDVIANLVQRGWPYKFIATCTIVQKTGAGFHSFTSCYWDQTNDTSCTVRWENKSMHCIAQILAIRL
ncbi:dynein light chain Tctex-type 1 [Tetranychus urticae]|uniref:Ubiquitin-like domain-containing protein n=1 Tax=Tetranychus urticae TaxID=32264 RepID=T1KNG7_TETUR|nr:dynein light chain Tctex-type 1 [Tetranychus urticae]